MDFVCAPAGIVDARWPKQGMKDMQAAGFSAVMLDASLGHPARLLEKGKPEPGMKAFLAAAKDSGCCLPLAMAPRLLPETKREDLAGRIEALAKETLADCAAAGCRKLVLHPMFAGIARGALWDENRAYFLRLAEAARAQGVQLLLANDVRSVNGHYVRGLLASGRAMRDMVDALNEAAGEDAFGCCLDMQAAGACGQDLYDFIHEVWPRLQAVLLTDTDGDGRKQLLPYTLAERGQSEADWLGVIRGLRAIGFDGLLVLALRDTAAACPPLLRPALLAFAKKTGEYLAWQIGMEREIAKYPQRVLFGAGRMCRNYLLNYGKAYPPLFTCDNNPATWGTEVDGLPVKPPEALRELPEDCAIFICNIYYRDIEAQLREMGLRNPVAYFNDECPPRVVLEKMEKRG